MKFLNKYESEFVFLFFKWYFWSRYKSNLYVITLKHKLKTKYKNMSYLKFDKTLMTNLGESLPKEILRTNRSGAYHCTTIVDCNTYCCRHWMKLSYSMVPNLTWGFISIRGIITVREVISTFVSSNARKFLRRSIV